MRETRPVCAPIGLLDRNRPRSANAAVTINVTNQAMVAWRPMASLERYAHADAGQTYPFVVKRPGIPSSSLRCRGRSGGAVGRLRSSGNGTATGTVTFTPSNTTPASLSTSERHAAMTGTIDLVAARRFLRWARGDRRRSPALMAAGTAAVRRRRRGQQSLRSIASARGRWGPLLGRGAEQWDAVLLLDDHRRRPADAAIASLRCCAPAPCRARSSWSCGAARWLGTSPDEPRRWSRFVRDPTARRGGRVGEQDERPRTSPITRGRWCA